ncbi:hypothetical protein D3C80_996870 [compost metagenome]
MRILDGHIGRMRAAVTDRNAKTLRGADGDIRTHFARRLQQRQRQEIGGDGGDGAGLMQAGNQAREIADMAVGARILEDRAEHIDGIEIGERVADDHLPAERGSTGLDQRDGLRVAIGIDKEGGRLGFGDALAHGHCFGSGRRFIEQRCVGDIKAGQVADHGLVVQKRFETTLADFRLVGRIGRVPGWIFQNIALDDRRRDRAVITLTDQRGQHLVLVGRFAQAVERLAFGQRCTPGQRHLLADGGGNGGVDERVEAFVTNDLQHVSHFRRRRPDVTPVGEIIGLIVGEMEFCGRRHYAISSL